MIHIVCSDRTCPGLPLPAGVFTAFDRKRTNK